MLAPIMKFQPSFYFSSQPEILTEAINEETENPEKVSIEPHDPINNSPVQAD